MSTLDCADQAPMKVGAKGAPSVLSLAFAVEINLPCLLVGKRPSE